jgi:hypothetical protein
LNWDLNGSSGSIPFFFVIFVAFCEDKQKPKKATKQSIATIELALQDLSELILS